MNLKNVEIYVLFPSDTACYFITNTLAFQKGELFTASIFITVTEVLLCYLLDYFFLKHTSNFFTYKRYHSEFLKQKSFI